ncbi:MAG: glycoside hydrolase family 99-like domain-containing protein, partial [bacterium]
LRSTLELIRFSPCPDPLVSIVIPFHNQLKYSAECLLSLSKTEAPSPACEIILADDASTEANVEILKHITSVRYLRHDTHQGFLLTCNRAAKEARGRYIVFLNNDTQVTRGWLQALVDVFSTCPDAGIAGPKVIYPSGHLQEAGGLVRGDLSTEMVGLNDDPARPCYNVRRPVDYCSGVCMMVERERFQSLGGFSEELKPAYYEDVDFCLKMRQAGRRVYYEPRSVVVHHLSKSHKTSKKDIKQALIARNRDLMFHKWQGFVDASAQVRLIAFYLPQFHPIPENDLWWGTGFTEWRNVTAAEPVFEGHVQPRLPGDLGFYDLREADVMERQATLARHYGLQGFCYYYYSFGGKRLLEMPLERMLKTGKPDFPFCLCWANENWTRRWDGRDDQVLMPQSHSPEEDEMVIRDMIRYLGDPRYIRINGRPLVLIYRTPLFPDIQATSEQWRRICRQEGLGEICLAGVESFGAASEIDPVTYGFDFTVAFPPHGTPYRNNPLHLKLNREALVYHYLDMVRHAARQAPFHPHRILGVCPGWDNTPRRKSGSTIFARSTPGEYQAWLEWTIHQTRRCRQGEERLVFINAWNEWAEGAVLEPDAQQGPAYLEATRNALFNTTVR